MQKKSLLVALFCGALCLTGCLKNEESASVAQVRIAKANELNSIADLNKAKAQAEVIYANAEATIAKAEAALKEAEAALVNAQAATEKVQAELLAVEVKLQEVKVEEEKVKLQMMQANLESRLAALEVEMAAAEAAKQAWTNVLEQLLADNEIAAIKNAQAIYEAQAQLDSLILVQEGAKADSAKVYAALYFQALDTVAKLQTQVIETKVARVLIERGAMDVREYIYDQIDEKTEQIEENNARIAELKEYQTMDPEEAEAKLEEARLALNKVYNTYMAASEAKNKAETEFGNLTNMTADFTLGWDGAFKNDLNSMLGQYIKGEWVDYDYATGVTGKVYTTGYYDEEDNFVPLYRGQRMKQVKERYPDIDVYHGNENNTKDFIKLTTTYVAPAEINYDNIKTVADGYVVAVGLAGGVAAVDFEEYLDEKIEGTEDFKGLKEIIADNNKELALHQKFVDTRKAKIEAAEKKFKEDLGKKATAEEAVETAWADFQTYMFEHYNASRQLVIDRYVADTTYKHYDALYQPLKTAYETKKNTTIPQWKSEVSTLAEAEANAQGEYFYAYGKAYVKDEYRVLKHELDSVKGHWDPDFAASNAVPKYVAGTEVPGTWRKGTGATAVNAGTSQAATLWADSLVRKIEADIEKIEELIVRFPKGSREYDETWYEPGYEGRGLGEIYAEAKQDLKDAQTEYNTAVRNEGLEERSYNRYLSAYERVWGAVEDAKKAWNPDFCEYIDIIADVENCKLRERYTQFYDATNGWIHEGEKAGTAQVNLLNKLKAIMDGEADVKEGSAATTTWGKYNAAKILADGAKTTLDEKETALKAGIGATKDQTAEDKYVAYLGKVADNAKVVASYKSLDSLYKVTYIPDAIGAAFSPYGEENHPADPDSHITGAKNAKFSWFRSNFHVNPAATYLDEDGKEQPLYKVFSNTSDKKVAAKATKVKAQFNWRAGFTINVKDVFIDEDGEEVNSESQAARIPDYTGSLTFKNAELQAIIDQKPDLLKQAEKLVKDEIDKATSKAEALIAKVNAYKAHEASYKTWVSDCAKAEKAVNDAKKAEFDAEQDYKAALAKYKALDAVANEGMWVCWGLDNEGNPIWTKLNIADSIEYLEDQNEGLEEDIEDLKQMLKDGKTAYALVNQILDEQLLVIEERIEIWLAIANQYKAIMNGYLGIVDEAVVEEPVEEEGEGDDEE